MDTEKIDIFSRLDELRTAVFGTVHKILPETFLMKTGKSKDRFGNTYAIRHTNRTEIVLIDAVLPENKKALQGFLKKGYKISAVLLTSGEVLEKSYAPIEQIKKDLKGAPVFIHPLDMQGQEKELKDITSKPQVFKHFDISIYPFPGGTGGSVLIRSGLNGGMLFTGDSAIGSPYEDDSYSFERPSLNDETEDFGLAESWKNFEDDFEHFLPRHGKPQFELEEETRDDILRSLGKD